MLSFAYPEFLYLLLIVPVVVALYIYLHEVPESGI